MRPGSVRCSSVLVAFVVCAIGACTGNLPEPAQCTQIPDGGCPIDNGANVCSDRSCSAAYACNSGKWVLSQTCPARPLEAGSPKDGQSGDGATAPDVSFDAPPGSFGGPGCTDLEMPDCSVGTALACLSSPDCCGCLDLWVCDAGGWVSWGTCIDGGLSKN